MATACISRLNLTATLFLSFALGSLPALLHSQADGGASDARVQKLYGEAKAAEARGDLAGAVASYESLLQIAPRLAPAYNNLGSLYLTANRNSDAIQALTRAVALDPRLANAHNGLGVAYARSGDVRKAVDEWQEALRLRPDLADARENLARVRQ